MGWMGNSGGFLMSERKAMNREQLKVNKEERKCTDCLHCKVAYCSLRNSRLCFCAKDKNKIYDLETYWLTKAVCKRFKDMAC